MTTSSNGSASPLREVATLAFLDLETTGLPELEFFKTKITELVIVAVSVAHFLESEELPRVQHKLKMAFNPFKRIDLKSTEVTGLTNELLEHEKRFDKNAMNLIECFLFQLQQPVCLIAHNGIKFDFPIFTKQCKILQASFPFTLKCCDSLPIFQEIDKLAAKKVQVLRDNFSLKAWNDIKDDKMLLNDDVERLLESATKCENGLDDEEDVDRKVLIELVQEEIKMIEKEEKDVLDDILAMQAINETTPVRKTKPTNLQPHAQIINDSNNLDRSTIKRELIFSTSGPSTSKKSKKSFALREIYKRFFLKYPKNSHDAESDVIALLKCANACKVDFVSFVNQKSISFANAPGF